MSDTSDTLGTGRSRSWLQAGIMLIAFMATMGLLITGCGTDDTSTAPTAMQVSDTCFQPPTAEEEAQLANYIRQQGDDVKTYQDADGDQSICVVETAADGTVRQHYYRPDDGLANYAMYAWMFGHSQQLATLAAASDGNLSTNDILMLSLMRGTDDRGSLYAPYHYEYGSRTPTRVSYNTYVSQVSYGKSKPVPYSVGKTQRPKGYTTKSLTAPTIKPAPSIKQSNPDIKRGGLGVPGQASKTQPKSSTSAPKYTPRPPGSSNLGSNRMGSSSSKSYSSSSGSSGSKSSSSSGTTRRSGK